MEELIRSVSEKAGLNLAESEKAVSIVVETLRRRLPAPLAVHLDAILGSDVARLETEIGEVLNGEPGGLFVKKKDVATGT